MTDGGKKIPKALRLQPLACGLAALQALPMAVIDGGIQRYRLLIRRKLTGDQTGALCVMLGACKIQKGIIGIKQGNGIRHNDLL